MEDEVGAEIWLLLEKTSRGVSFWCEAAHRRADCIGKIAEGIWRLGKGADGELLSRYYDETDVEQANALLEELCRQARPIANGVVLNALAARLRDDPSAEEDIGSLEAEAVDLLRLKLWASKESSRRRIEGFTRYLTTIARNVCLKYLKWRKGNRARLREALRFTLKHHPKFALWIFNKLTKLGWIGGLCAWRRRGPVSITPLKTADKAVFDPGQNALASLSRGEYSKLAAGLLVESFRLSGGPLVFNDLVSVLAERLGIEEVRLVSGDEPQGDEGPTIVENLVSTTVLPDTSADLVEQLTPLWSMMKNLPLDRLRVLILNPQGDADSSILAGAGVVSIADMAIAMGWPPEKLAGLWNQLPLDDSRIAAELRCSKKRVATLRFEAKQDLRLQAHEKKGA